MKNPKNQSRDMRREEHMIEKVISAKGVESFICTDGTINVDKVLRSIPEEGNEELFEMLSKRKMLF